MDIRNLEGSIVALVTPFTADGDVDFEALGRLVDFHLEAGTDAILTLGTTGESSTMTDAEDDAVCAFVVERVSGRIPVIAGSGSNSTQTMLAKSLSYQRLGADGLLIITPYYNKANEEGIYRHLATVADAVDVPCILYNIPGRAVVNVQPETVAKLAELPRIAGIKDATGDLARPWIERSLIKREDFTWLSGEDATQVSYCAAGGHGCISVTANIAPALVAQVQQLCAENRYPEARALQDKLLPLHQLMFKEPSPAPVKYAASLLGLCAEEARLPIVPLSEPYRIAIKDEMQKLGLLG